MSEDANLTAHHRCSLEQCRVTNLAFSKLDFDNLAFLARLASFKESKKSMTKSGFFWIFSEQYCTNLLVAM